MSNYKDELEMVGFCSQKARCAKLDWPQARLWIMNLLFIGCVPTMPLCSLQSKKMQR